MESKVRTVLSGLGACVALGLFLVGVPICLVKLVGNPLPAGVPSWSSVVAAVEGGALPAGALSSVLAVAVWIWWSQAALSFAAEAWAALRGRTARALPLRALGMQPIMVRLVAIVLAAASTLGALVQPVVAATPSFAEIAVPIEVAAVAEPSRGARSATLADAVDHPAAVGGLPAAPILGPPQAAGPEPSPSDRALGAAPSPEVANGPVAVSAAAPVLGLPSESHSESLQPDPAPAAERATSVSTAAPVLGLPSESQPELSQLGPAPAGEGATSARWDPVLAHYGAAPAGEASTLAVDAPADEAAEFVEELPVPAKEVPAVPVDELPAPAKEESPAPAEELPVVPVDDSGWIVVKPGDSLWGLAEQHLGDAHRWRDLFELNVGQLAGGGTLRDPNLIHPGWRLRLPPPDQSASAELAGAAEPDTPVSLYDPVLQ